MAEDSLIQLGTVGSSKAVTAVTAVASEVAKGATTALVKSFVERVVTPYFSGKKAKAKIVSGTLKYTRNIEFRTRCVPTIAIQGGTFALDDVYEPLQLIRVGEEKPYRVEGYPSRLFNENRCVVVVDAAGMGKSTLTKYVIRRCLSEYKKIPLLIELRRLKHGQSIIDFICGELVGGNAAGGTIDDLKFSLMEGNYLFLLDGYDEVDPEIREEISGEISRISAEYQYCNFWLTSRPDPALSGFTEFTAFEISKLTFEQACSLLRRYDKGRGLAQTLIDKLDALPQVHDFLGNPLLVTLLYKAFDYKATIPVKRNIFFRQVFDALYQDHDLSKEGAFERRKKSALDIDDFHRFMRALGFVTFKAGKVQYSQVDFTNFIKEAAQKSQLAVDSSKIKADVLSAVPIFVREGNDVRWAHKAFQDYFASQFIYYDSAAVRDDLIEKLFCSESVGRYENILCMLGELDLGLLRERCVLPFLEKLGLPESEGWCVTSEFLDGASDVYAVQVSSKTRHGPHFEEVLAEMKKAYPQLELTDGSRMTFFTKERIALIALPASDALRHRIVGKIDPASFPLGRARIDIAEIKALMTGTVLSLNRVLRNSGTQERLLQLARSIAYVADVSAPTSTSLQLLKQEVAARTSTHAAESLLDGL